MRSAARGISLAVLALFTIFLLWNFFAGSGIEIPSRIRHLQIPLIHKNGGASTFAPATDKDELQQQELYIPDHYPSVEALWYQWSKVLYDNRPRIEKIKLDESAPNVGVHSKDTNPRNPYSNLVANPSTDLLSMEESHTGLLQELGKLGNTTGPYHGHGVVLVGGAEYYGPAITTIQMLRRAGCDLPVEVFVKDRGEYEEYVCEQFFPKIGASCLVITDFMEKGAHKFTAGHYQLKVLALLFSSFQHVLFLDSDSMPLMDPYQKMMKAEPYASTGMVVWPDFWMSTESPEFYKIAGMAGFPENLPKTSTESGQMLLDKGTHLEALLLSTYYNIYGPDLYYRLLSQGAMGEGDKETFMAAAVVVNSSFYRVKHPVEAVMNDDGERSKGRAMLQFHAGDEMVKHEKPTRPAFLHANLPKMNAGHLIDEGDLFSEVDKAKRWRLLGDKEKQIRVFGYDVEATIWSIMIESGCDLADKIKDWKDRLNMCERLHKHYSEVFGNDTVVPTRPSTDKVPAAAPKTSHNHALGGVHKTAEPAKSDHVSGVAAAKVGAPVAIPKDMPANVKSGGMAHGEDDDEMLLPPLDTTRRRRRRATA